MELNIGDILKNIQTPDPKAPKHEKAAIVNEIIAVVGDHPKYNFKYWLRMIGNRTYGEMLGLLKEISNAPDKFPKGALLTNKLRKTKKK